MKIVIISQSFDISSGQGVFRAAGELSNHLEKAGIKVFRIEAPNTRDFIFYFSLFLKSCKFNAADIFHIFMPEYFLFAFKNKLFSKSIVTIHDCVPLLSPERHFIHTCWSRVAYKIIKKFKALHCPSTFTKTEVQKLFRLPSHFVYAIPWGVDLKKFKNKNTSSVFSEENGIRAGYLGGFGKRKNVEWIIYLAKKFPEAVFYIAGRGKELRKIRFLSERLHLKNVRFIGFVPEEKLPEFYSFLDIFLFPSEHEGYGFPVIEAFASGVPYIITQNTGIAKELPVIKATSFNDFLESFKLIISGQIEPIKHHHRIIEALDLTWDQTIEKFLKMYDDLR